MEDLFQGNKTDTIKELMSYPKYRSVKVINNPARSGSIYREVNYIYIYNLTKS
jgi:hydroxypyruvate isomerase